MLIIVKDRNIEFFFQAFFDLEAAWSRNVFEIDPAEGNRNVLDSLDDLVRIFRAQAYRERINTAKLFEQLGLSFHNGHCSGRTDIAKA